MPNISLQLNEVRHELLLNKSHSRKKSLLKDYNLTFSDRQYNILLGIIPSVSSVNIEDIAPLCLIQRRQILLKFNFSLLHWIIFIHNPAYDATNFQAARFWWCDAFNQVSNTLKSHILCAQIIEVGHHAVWLPGVLFSKKLCHLVRRSKTTDWRNLDSG